MGFVGAFVGPHLILPVLLPTASILWWGPILFGAGALVPLLRTLRRALQDARGAEPSELSQSWTRWTGGEVASSSGPRTASIRSTAR